MIDNGHLTVEWGESEAPTSLDPFTEAIALAEARGSAITALVTTPQVASAVVKLRTRADSNVPLLGANPTTAISRQVLGVPLIVNTAVAPGTIWC